MLWLGRQRLWIMAARRQKKANIWHGKGKNVVAYGRLPFPAPLFSLA